MKTIYQLKFEFFKFKDKNFERDRILDIFLSDIEDISSEYPLSSPFDGEIMSISGIDYKVLSSKISIDVDRENNIMYYTKIMILRNEIIQREIENEIKTQQEELRRKRVNDEYLLEKLRQTAYEQEKRNSLDKYFNGYKGNTFLKDYINKLDNL